MERDEMIKEQPRSSLKTLKDVGFHNLAQQWANLNRNSNSEA